MNIDNPKYDVCIIGAGPVGITLASALKAMSPCQVCVIDERPEPTRNHGLKIRSDSVDKIHSVLEQALKEYTTCNSEQIKNLKKVFTNWRDSFIRTTKIELSMAEVARQFGVTILRGKSYSLPKENPLEKPELQAIMKQARVIIGADGAHSTVREMIGSQLVDVKTLQYLVELKYQTDGKATPRSYAEAFIESALCGQMDIESMHKGASEENKPVTLHIFVDKSTYEALRVVDNEGRLKGVFGNSWTLEEIKTLANKNKNIKNIYSTFQKHLKGIASRGGTCEEAKISTLAMTIYRSEKSVAFYKGKYVVLVGDANSGMVLERGFNKGLKEAALCAKAVADFFYRFKEVKESIPAPLTQYQQDVKKIFEDEKSWAIIKNFGIGAVQSTFASTQFSIDASYSTSNAIQDSASSVSSTSSNSFKWFGFSSFDKEEK